MRGAGPTVNASQIEINRIQIKVDKLGAAGAVDYTWRTATFVARNSGPITAAVRVPE